MYSYVDKLWKVCGKLATLCGFVHSSQNWQLTSLFIKSRFIPCFSTRNTQPKSIKSPLLNSYFSTVSTVPIKITNL